ncbi:PP0621 family protein [Pseudomonas corrugata]|uniref:PP0621 family protein n=1 Tax=Pseudomonas corrugata TaxID=47879 RepID=UPI0009B80CD9|nr:PP0621 family protein [Pseudomonas corrugata]MDU9025468.1 PP0621 family protein [Pseudomonas corrugata]MDU9036089.1 PP0621 family protein [Pseudomonas corrugata]MDU9041274.1 PP0621 family protein [Pseudomonas corrugata]UZD94589.1 PP0621 family protein [Pseudomonas corrugata]
MLRLIILFAVVASAIWIFRNVKPKASAAQSSREQDAPPMVRCAHCGVHLPRDRALPLQQQWYCSQAHLEQGPGPRDH